VVVAHKSGSAWVEAVAAGGPLSDERGTTDRVGRFNFFAAGIMFWTPRTGAHEVHGAILDRYARLGYESHHLATTVQAWDRIVVVRWPDLLLKLRPADSDAIAKLSDVMTGGGLERLLQA